MKKIKTFGKWMGGAALAGIAGLALATMCGWTERAHANTWMYVSLSAVTNLEVVTNGTLTNYSGTGLQLTPNAVYLFTANASSTSTSTVAVIYGFDGAPDNTNYSLGGQLKFTNTLVGGSNAIVFAVNTYPTGNAAGWNWIKFTSFGAVSAASVSNSTLNGSFATNFPGAWYF